MTTATNGHRPIREGSWVRVRLPGHRPFLSTVLRIRDDGTVDVVDPRRAVRTLRPETLTPANRPKVIPAHVKVPGR